MKSLLKLTPVTETQLYTSLKEETNTSLKKGQEDTAVLSSDQVKESPYLEWTHAHGAQALNTLLLCICNEEHMDLLIRKPQHW